ncbi:MAG: helix-turn-helix domain-containing protein [Oscillibacter sp.]|nr:helix-turn-helix domain-containing protein [Oscillibacter sp.]MBQ2996473.1 helix-turn-helix domain-containing protein [Oscillibacter sp.]
MNESREASRRGYLHEDFRLFHLKDSRAQQVDSHYHDFDKLVLVLQGRVTYIVEGVTYFLQPWDMVLVPRGMIHRPVIDPAEPYERIIVYLGRAYLQSRSEGEAALEQCFETVRERGFHLLRLSPERRIVYMNTLRQMEEALRSREFGASLLAEALCRQLLVFVNRDVISSHTALDAPESYRVDKKMEEILQYIAANLTEDLGVETLSLRFYLSRYYLMHRFKEVTGYTVHQYISQKRLLAAAELLRQGVSVTKAAEQAGFREYSTFLRSFRAMFHMTPKEFRAKH